RRAENPLSPGIGLKEVFDVSNAVHRMEEESRRRHTPQPSGLQAADNRQRQAIRARSGKAISASTTVSTIASSSTTSSASSTNRRRRAGFELNMGQATLLKRRAKNVGGGASPLHQTVEQQDQMLRHQTPAVAV
ncbi:hypothetical protein BGZ91_010879, partial [Linnemannia elongata]